MDEDQLHAVAHPQPPQEGALVPVLAAVVRRADRYLVGLRAAHKRHGGYWEFPGGKIKPGETLLEAAQRELKEELGVEVLRVVDPIFSAQDPDSTYLIQFAPVEIAGTPQALEHDLILWATQKELLALRLAPADRKFLNLLAPQISSG